MVPTSPGCSVGQVEDVRWLVEQGEELEARDRWSGTVALELAGGELAKAEI